MQKLQVSIGKLRRVLAQANLDEEAFNKIFPEGDHDKEMFEPQVREEASFFGEPVTIPGTAESLEKAEKARAELAAMKQEHEADIKKYTKGVQRGVVSPLDAIEAVLPYFLARKQAVKMPAITINDKFFDAKPGTPEHDQAQAYADFHNRNVAEVDQEFLAFLKSIV